MNQIAERAQNKIVSERMYSFLANGSVCFEGFFRPSVRVLREDGQPLESPDERFVDQTRQKLMLENYFNDLYKLFLRKLAIFECQAVSAEEDTKRLVSLLGELIKVKEMLAHSSPR